MPSKTSTVRISTAALCVSTKHSPVKSVAAVAAAAAAVDTVAAAAAAVIAVAAAAAVVIGVAAAAVIAVAAAAAAVVVVAAVVAGNHPQLNFYRRRPSPGAAFFGGVTVPVASHLPAHSTVLHLRIEVKNP